MSGDGLVAEAQLRVGAQLGRQCSANPGVWLPVSRNLGGVQRELDLHAGARARGSLHGEPAAECLDSVFEPDETRPAGQIGSAASVVAAADYQDGVGGVELDVDSRGVGVLSRVGQRLGDLSGSNMGFWA
jgi:hypothetical protein